MESTNYLHQLQTASSSSSSSSSLTPPSTYATSAATWTQNYTLNPIRQKHEISNPHLNNLMIQELGFEWNSNKDDDEESGKIKQELSSECFPKFSEMLLNTSTSPSNEDDQLMNDLTEKLLLKTISSGFPINTSHIYSTPNNLSFSQIYPTINISNLNPPTISPPAFDINLQALDLLTSTTFSANFHHPFHHNFHNVMHHSTHIPSSNPTNIPSSTEAKRPSNSFIDPKPTQSAPKKSRLDSRASCPPFKVRKEKLGDRIASLQQLVAPFGKTDTASVLMEAIGYIKFLQNQVETLSVPYMKSSRNKSSRTTQAFQGEEGKKDLRSRGLCLVPLSCMSYVTGDGGGGIWPPPNFGGSGT